MPPLINRATLGQITDSTDTLRSIIRVYLESTPDTLEKICAGIAAGETQQIAMAVHSLKGSSAAIGAEPLVERCQQLYMAARSGDSESAARLVSDVECCYKETTTALRALEFD